ncbi:O-antigen ligase family protein [Thioclava indica]|uniref:O-antigen polymerase n=1 Tax=Thioclava indica TaxID=1353528 RepID=A0A074JHP9_9RHOB|nr:O-antigen ligase family protein [Thioclava indica]KEO57111.1 hypothetical protein DT23_17230 [Thioclava indica]
MLSARIERARSHVLNALVRFLYLTLVVSSVISLGTFFSGIPIYLPYIPAVLLIAGLSSVFIVNPTIQISRGEDTCVLIIAVLPLFFSNFAIYPDAALADSIVFLYFGVIYFATKYLLRIGLLTAVCLLRYLGIVFFILVSIGLLQVATRSPIGLVSLYVGSSDQIVASYDGAFRVSGTLVSPNVFGNILALLFPVGFWVLRRQFGRKNMVAISVLLVAVVATDILYSGSRAAFLFLSVSFASTYIVWLRVDRSVKNKWLSALVLVLTLLAVSTLVLMPSEGANTILDRLTMTTGSGRISMYYGALNLLQNPKILIVGSGAGQFFREVAHVGIHIDYKNWVNYNDLHSSVHNWMLQSVTENGIIYFFAWIFFLVILFRRALYLKRVNDDWFTFIIGLNLMLLYLLPLQFDTSMNNPSILTIVAVCAALISHRARIAAKDARQMR